MKTNAATIMKTKICLLGFLLAFSVPVWASLYESGTLPGGTIPDDDYIGLTESVMVSGQDPSISGVTLTFTLQGGASTDLSGYLRLGNTDSSPYYSLTSLVQGQTLSAGSPTSYSIDFTTPAFQSAFNGQNPNDTWTLFFADTVSGDQTTLNGWSLNVSAVPEPVNVAQGLFGGLALLWWCLGLCWKRTEAGDAELE